MPTPLRNWASWNLAFTRPAVRVWKPRTWPTPVAWPNFASFSRDSPTKVLPLAIQSESGITKKYRSSYDALYVEGPVMSEAILLLIYCVLVLLVSLLGGSVPLYGRVTH